VPPKQEIDAGFGGTIDIEDILQEVAIPLVKVGGEELQAKLLVSHVEQHTPGHARRAKLVWARRRRGKKCLEA